MADTFTMALTGNPNSGKTTSFNALTGSRQHVGNYPGVTVDCKEGFFRHEGRSIRVVDLPGTYSLTAYTAEEISARDFLLGQRPDAVVDVLDANTLERSLYLAVQLLEMGAPLVLSLNMMDEVRKKDMQINTALLSELIGCPVIETVARTGEGRDAMINAALSQADDQREWKPLRISYSADMDEALLEMEDLINAAGFLTDRFPARWLALKYLEGDEQIRVEGRKAGELSNSLEAIADRVEQHCRKTLNTDPEAVIADYRYGFIASLMKKGVVRRGTSQTRIEISDKVDRVVTSALFGPALMLFVLYAMFQITFTLGEVPMGWVETMFGWLSSTASTLLPDGLLKSLVVSGIIDGVGGVLGFVPLIVIMFLMLSFLEDLGYMARMAYMLDRVFKAFGLHGCSVMPFIISGGIPGGCAVPGVMAARTLRSPKERLATILTAPFMVCGAKVPVFILLVAAFFPQSAGNAMFWITLVGWAAALLVAKLLRSTVLQGEPTPFLMELPPYRMPTLRGVLLHTWERAWQYIKKAGTVILGISVLFWAAMTFPALPEHDAAQFDAQRTEIQGQLDQATTPERIAALEAQLAEVDNVQGEAALKYSVAGRVGSALEGLTRLAGFDWRVNIALIGGIAAKEVIVSTMGTAYSLGEVDPDDAAPLSERLARDPAFTTATAVSLIIFILLYAPCFVTVVAMAKEASWGWAAFAVTFNTVLAFILASAAYQILSGLS
ncbi:ferrous iron transport protein B [Paucidesulfovibrio gracilis DSM 16080]|uniref:Ferrous iron transport protein B n=1 Tax=Paucidesulfovibrio gracilis DSM 16080 TaxID=1121449 RepID=A0A1T4XFG6_9BACT|nr:ferrous iron transport protein B [Paucidesulfovibrio gracilis]SKA88332.1 ferrous iron transport protein B [Paucidesulfovibrio gracilis DSM 16080]